MVKPSEQIVFQPGDVVGWNVHPRFMTIEPPLSVVYRNATTGEQGVDVKSSSFSSFQPVWCLVSECTDDVSVQNSIIPYLSLQYDALNDNGTDRPSVHVCDEQEEDTTCILPTVTTLPPTCIGNGCSSGGSSISLNYVIASVSILFVIVILVIITIISLTTTKRNCCLSKHHKKNVKSKEDIPNSFAGDDGHHNSTGLLHFETDNGDIYALPNAGRPNPGFSTIKTNLADMFDGECYASTYQTNGQCHIYQELPESAKPISRNTSKSMFVSHELIRSKPPIPLRFSSSTSLTGSKFPYTMPNTPSPSAVYDPESYTMPSVSPYQESKPTLSRNGTLNSSGYPYQDYKLSLPCSPNDTPPGITMRKLFHAVDDEILRVPNTLERQEFNVTDNPDDIYSKLKYSHSVKNRDSVDNIILDQSDMYWAPSSSTSGLYDQLAKRKFREIQRNQVSITECIGEGNFGTVHKGLWKVPGGVLDVAVKTLNPKSPDDNEIKFLKEAAIMGQFIHPNVIKLLGVVTVGEPLMIVLELMPGGDLHKYLQTLSSTSLPEHYLPRTLLTFCRQIGYGMNYLTNKGFVHRDLAARNVLLTKDITCKIGDFGMSRDLEEESVYFSQGSKMPLKWTAPEALKYQQFSSASDVWSYGMLLFEIWSLGKIPFNGIKTKRMMTMVHSGYCQPPPPGCPRSIYQLMVQCWHTQPENRITFSKICEFLNSSTDEETLLAFSKDVKMSTKAKELGAPLLEAKNLYLDLQFIYTNSMV